MNATANRGNEETEATRSAGSAPAQLDEQVMLDLQQLASRYWALADGTEEVPIADLFSPDAVLELGKLRLVGADAIDRFFQERDLAQKASNRTTRHFACNFLATPITADQVRVRSTVMVYSDAGALPLPLSSPSGIADFDDICVRTGPRRWVYQNRAGRTVFAGPGAPEFAR